MLLELDHVRRRQVVRDQDQALLVAHGRRRHVTGLAEQRLQQALDDLDHVGLALAQVAVLDLVELVEQRVHLHLERPLGVALLGFDDLARRFRQRRVVEDHQVQVEKCLEFLRRAGRDLRAQLLELGAHGFQRRIEARRFLGDLVLRHDVMRDFEPGVRHQMRVSDGDATGHRDAVHGEAHALAP